MKKDEYYNKVITILILSCALFAVTIVLLIVELCTSISHIVITNTNIVLTFVGILATFIVVGNYIQVLKIEKDVNNRIDDITLKTTTRAVKKVVATPDNIGIESNKRDIFFKMAMNTNDLDARLVFLNKAIDDSKNDQDLLKKLESIKGATEEAKRKADSEDFI
ncbi:MAG: hypothetical protein IK122_00305 [Alphaproteobacteria bacterium]|nr:hypothetical protein [Alphaproteobacteria bacterium]